MEMNITLYGIAEEVSTIYVNCRCFHTFLLNCEDKGIYRVYVRDEDNEDDINDGDHYCAYGFEIAEGIVMATSCHLWGRICEVCGKWHTEGYWIDELNYACSEECALHFYGGDADAFHAELALLDNPATANDAYTYWTEWE